MIPGATLRPSLVLPLVAALAVGSCDRPAPTEAAGPGSLIAPVEASLARRGGDRPMRANGGAVLLSQTLAPDAGPPLFGRSDFDGRCSEPSDFTISFRLEGQATHLGRITAVAEHCSWVDWELRDSWTNDGVMMFTAANGDDLWATYEGEPSGTGTREVLTFTGGTGRFASASGGGIFFVDCDRTTGTCVWEFTGTLSFDASDARQRH